MLHMLLHLEAHLIKIENMLTKKKIDDMFDSPEFKVRLPFTVSTIISDLNDLDWFTRSSPRSFAVSWHTCVCDRCHNTDDGKSFQLTVYFIIIFY